MARPKPKNPNLKTILDEKPETFTYNRRPFVMKTHNEPTAEFPIAPDQVHLAIALRYCLRKNKPFRYQFQGIAYEVDPA